MPLTTYRTRRDFSRTPEPRGKTRMRKSRGWSFVVQKHAASHLHYDFRLELDGVLLSWAVPKGPSLDPADKRLAMRTSDHPVEYGGFEGVIPPGQYGGGTVMLWDHGTWTPQSDPREGLRDGRLKFELDGDKLRGGWILVRTRKGRDDGARDDRAWLLIKERDGHAKERGPAIVDGSPDSVATGRSLDDIARSEGKSEGARKAALPDYVAPMLTTLVATPPEGDDWILEIKYDGYRLVARIEHGKVRLYSRNGKDWTATFPRVAQALAALPAKSAWIDGEVVVLDASGKSSFQGLQAALTSPNARGLAFFAFDVMHLDGDDLRAVPLTKRKSILRALVGDASGVVRTGPETRGSGQDFFEQACALGLEGIVAKRAPSAYASGLRTRDWQKIKCIQRQELVIGGYTDPQRSRKGFGALLLGYYEGGKLRYAGKVGTGFDDATLRKLAPELAKRGISIPAFADPPRGYDAKGAHWIRPELVAEIAFTEWSRDGALRHPSFQGMRPDRKAADIVRERPQAPAVKRPVVKGSKERVSIAGVELSNPDKAYFPEAGITKGDIARYYADVAPRLLPHLKGRPLSLVRCPDGWQGQCFYQKHADRAVGTAVTRVQVPERGGGTATYMSAGSAAALAALVQWGVVEMHPWGSRKPRLDKPDRLIFDFDPDPALPFEDLVSAVTLMRALFDEMKLTSFLKTTGGKGLHVVLPIRATLTWDEAKSFSKSVADFMVRAFPDRFVATISKTKRKGKILIDYLRNAEGATAVAPYAVRARANAPVATPIHWRELDRDVRGDHFNVENVRGRLASMKLDPWADFFSVRQSITAAMRKGLA